MNALNHEVFDLIKEWVDSGGWKTDPQALLFDEERGAHYVGYEASWFMDLTEEEHEALEEDESGYYSFLVSVYIWPDNSFKIEFDPGLFQLMYKGYDTEADRQAWGEFSDMAKEKGLLLEG